MSTRFLFHASLPTLAAGHRPFHLLSGGEAGESIDAGTLFFSVPASVFRFLPPARIKAGSDSDEKRCTEGPAGLRASLFNIVFSKRKELTTNARYLPFRRQF